MTADAANVPFSYKVKVATLSHVPLELRLSANEVERAGLAELWDILNIASLTAELKVRRWKKEGVKVIGTIRAEAQQACIVTLDPVDEVIEENVEETFAPEGSNLLTGIGKDEIVIDPDATELPEPFSGDTVDIGAMVAEIVAMALDPYPRRPGAEFSHKPAPDTGSAAKPSPFAVLKSLKVDE